MEWIAELREKKTGPTRGETKTSDRNLPRETSIDSEESAVAPEQTKAAGVGWRAFTLFPQTNQNTGGTAPVTPEPPHYRHEQTRDYENTPPSTHILNSQSSRGEQERMDAPLSPPRTPENKTFFHDIMASATDAWIVSQADPTNSSRITHEKDYHTSSTGMSAHSSPSLRTGSGLVNEPLESRRATSEHQSLYAVMASATEAWIESSSTSAPSSPHEEKEEDVFASEDETSGKSDEESRSEESASEHESIDETSNKVEIKLDGRLGSVDIDEDADNKEEDEEDKDSNDEIKDDDDTITSQQTMDPKLTLSPMGLTLEVNKSDQSTESIDSFDNEGAESEIEDLQEEEEDDDSTILSEYDTLTEQGFADTPSVGGTSLKIYESSAIKIQATARRINAKKQVERMNDNLGKIQSFARMTLVRVRLNRKSEAATKISSWIRGRWALQLLDDLKRSKAARKIQGFARMALGRQLFERQREATTVISSWIRKIWDLQQLDELKRTKAAQKVQSFARMALGRKLFERQRKATTKISSWIRGRLAVQLLSDLRKEKAAKTIQRHVRGYSTRREFAAKTTTIRIIQRNARRFVSEKIEVETKLQAEKSSHQTVTTDEPEEISPDFQEYLWGEISSLRSENDELKHKVTSIDAARQSLMTENERSGSAVKTYKSRIRTLTKANDGLAHELLTARQEATDTARKAQMERSQLEEKISMLENEQKSAKATHTKQIHELIQANQEIQSQTMEMIRRRDQETLMAKERYESQKRAMKEELKAVKQAHETQLSKFVDVIGSGQSKRHEAVANVTAELLAVRREKDEHISRLQQELKALRVSKRESKNIRAAVEPRSIQKQISGESELRSRRAAEFDVACQSLQSLISESCVLPRFIPKRDMESVIKQQERGQKMSEVLEKLSFLFKKEEDSQHQTSEAALALVKEYVAATQPNRTIANLKEQLEKAYLQNSRMREQSKEKGYCKRCRSPVDS